MFPAMEGAESEKNMKYENIRRAVFLERPNRFIARVELDGKTDTVHVKNTGRCRELLIPGSEVWLTRSGNPARKTKYDLIAVRKENGVLFNIDSQAANAAAFEWLQRQDWDEPVSFRTPRRSAEQSMSAS